MNQTPNLYRSPGRRWNVRYAAWFGESELETLTTKATKLGRSKNETLRMAIRLLGTVDEETLLGLRD